MHTNTSFASCQKSLCLSLFLSLAGIHTAAADTLGVYLGYGNWQQDISGQAALAGNSGAPSIIDLSSDLGHESSDGMMIWAAFEHPVPILPNIRIGRTEAKSSASQTLTRNINFGDVTFPSGTNTSSRFDISHNDYILYYEVLDNWFELDLGIDVKQFDGDVAIAGLNQEESETFDGFIPFIYTSMNFNLPLTGLKVGGEFSGISANGAKAQDYRVRIAYEFSFGLGLEAGQRYMNYKVDDSDEEFNGDVEFKGSYVAATFHF